MPNVQTTDSTMCAEQIIKNFITHDEVSRFQDSLTTMFDDFVCSEVEYDPELRRDVLFHYRTMMELLKNVEQYQNSNAL